MSFELIFLLLSTVPSVIGGTVDAVRRSVHRPDVLLTSACPAPCEQLFRARDNSSLNPCGCDCPPEAPSFLHTAGQCVEKLDECQTNIRFFRAFDGSSSHIPVAVLPAKNGVLLSKWRLVWHEAGLTERLGHVDCSVNAAFYENVEHRWKPTSRKLFALMPVGNRSSLIYRGSEGEAVQLAGSVVQLKLSCSGSTEDSICISFRVVGTSGHPPEESPKVRWELVLVCLCCVLLLALVATFYLGFLCWRLEKRRLIGRIQMQILCDYRRQQATHAQDQLSSVELGEGGGYKPVLLPKRRLLFHAEFLEREYLENPPEDAELFLAQLRRMVDAARERIRMRRFIPMLITIPEMPDEEEQSDSPPPSPNSTKSVDSGRDSHSDGSDHSSSSSPRALRPSKLPLPKVIPAMPVIVPHRPPLPSKIPTPVGSASPRTRKSLSVSNSQPKSYRERKGYAVFPADPMLNKSLPRRAKRSSIPGAVPPPIAPKPMI